MKNREDSQSKKTSKLTFSDKETEAYRHKAFFLHYLNRLEPEVEKALQELFPTYIVIFGRHEPFDREPLKFPRGFPEFFEKHFSLSSLQEPTEQGLGDCDRRYLAERHDLMKTAVEYKDQRLRTIDGCIDETCEHPNTSEIPGLRNELLMMSYQKALEDDEHLQEAHKVEEFFSHSLNQFRSHFFEKLIKRFHLEKDWLCLSAFLAIQEGKSKLEMPWRYTMHSYPTEMLQELYGDEHDSSIWSFLPRALPLHKSFQFDKPFGIYEKADEYEKEAVAIYREHLHKYVIDMQQALTSHGYKLRRRRHDYSRVEWLVRWTVQKWTVPEIASAYNAEESTIWKAFKRFENYELPVRKKKGGDKPEVLRSEEGA